MDEQRSFVHKHAERAAGPLGGRVSVLLFHLLSAQKAVHNRPPNDAAALNSRRTLTGDTHVMLYMLDGEVPVMASNFITIAIRQLLTGSSVLQGVFSITFEKDGQGFLRSLYRTYSLCLERPYR